MLPKGLKQMLVASENEFFNEVSGPPLMSPSRDVGNNRYWQPPTTRFDADHLTLED